MTTTIKYQIINKAKLIITKKNCVHHINTHIFAGLTESCGTRRRHTTKNYSLLKPVIAFYRINFGPSRRILIRY